MVLGCEKMITFGINFNVPLFAKLFAGWMVLAAIALVIRGAINYTPSPRHGAWSIVMGLAQICIVVVSLLL